MVTALTALTWRQVGWDQMLDRLEPPSNSRLLTSKRASDSARRFPSHQPALDLGVFFSREAHLSEVAEPGPAPDLADCIGVPAHCDRNLRVRLASLCTAEDFLAGRLVRIALQGKLQRGRDFCALSAGRRPAYPNSDRDGVIRLTALETASDVAHDLIAKLAKRRPYCGVAHMLAARGSIMRRVERLSTRRCRSSGRSRSLVRG